MLRNPQLNKIRYLSLGRPFQSFQFRLFPHHINTAFLYLEHLHTLIMDYQDSQPARGAIKCNSVQDQRKLNFIVNTETERRMQRLVLFLFVLCCFLAAVYGKGGKGGGGGRSSGSRSTSRSSSRTSSGSYSRCLKMNLSSIAYIQHSVGSKKIPYSSIDPSLFKRASFPNLIKTTYLPKECKKLMEVYTLKQT